MMSYNSSNSSNKDIRKIRIFDTTLRDGEQTPGIDVSPDQKIEIAINLMS